MTTPTLTPEEIQAAYLSGCAQNVADARMALLDHLGDEDGYAKALRVFREARVILDAARLNAYGEPCDRCESEGEFEVKQADGYYVIPCPACHGARKVMPEVNRETARKRPTERDIYHERECD